MTEVHAVLFDIGNVLIGWQPERFYDREYGAARRRQLFDTVDLHHMNELVDRGGNFRDTIYEIARRHPDMAEEIRQWHDRWIDLAGPVITPSVVLLRRLRAKGVPVMALSNFGIESFAVALSHFDFLNEFDELFVSGHLGVTKPDPEIYRLVEAGCGLSPEALFFTDDRAENIAAAQARGWHTHLFDGPRALGRRMMELGLLTADELEEDPHADAANNL
jgi:2-haloacid dehalogenase